MMNRNALSISQAVQDYGGVACPKNGEPVDQNEEPPSPPEPPSEPPAAWMPLPDSCPRVLTDLLRDASRSDWRDWRWQLARRFRSLKQLSALLGLKGRRLAGYRQLLDTYRFSATPYYLSLVNWDDPNDPILRQCVPDLAELEYWRDGRDDPLEEEEDMQVPGLVHRYPDRVLAVVTNHCAMYCRHCTRKRIWHEPEAERPYSDLERMILYVAATPEVREVIVSGGDPLTMNLEKLDWFLGALKAIPHVEVLRIGTRVPVVLPMRVTDDLCSVLGRHRPLWVNTQFNHPREITSDAADACDRILRTGIPVSNQTVLLRGINDSPETMRLLCHGLQRIMVRPYYLFQCDPVRGAEHFRTNIWTGIHIIETLRGHTGGLCIPTFVVDAPGGGGKVPLQPHYFLSATEDEVLLRNYEGMIIRYPNPREGDSQTCPWSAGRHRLPGTGPRPGNGQGNPSAIPQCSPRFKRRQRRQASPTPRV